MPENWLTLGDVWKPIAAHDVLQTMYLKDEMEAAKTRNRLLTMKGEEDAKQQGAQTAFENALAASQNAPNRQQEMMNLLANNPRAQFQAEAYFQAQQKVQDDQKKALLEQTAKVADVIHKLGPERFKELQPMLTGINPVFGKVDADKLRKEGTRILYPATTPDGREIPGTYLAYDDENKLHIVKSPTTGTLSAAQTANLSTKNTPESVQAYLQSLQETGQADPTLLVPKEKEPTTDFSNFRSGVEDELKKKGITDPGQIAREVSNRWHKQKMEEGNLLGGQRAQQWAATREYPVIDTKNNNTLAYMSAADLNAANKREPGRFAPAAQGGQALTKTALVEDIRGNIQMTRTSLTGLKTDFTASQAAQIAYVMKQRDPRSAISAFLASRVGTTLTPDQQDYLIDLAQLQENAMAMRSVLGAGQGSEDLRAAIMNTIPSAKTPSKAYAQKQLERFELVLNRLTRGIPNVPLRPMQGTTNQGGTPAESKKPITLDDFLKSKGY